MRVFIDRLGNKYGFDELKDGVMQPDWKECEPKEDGTYYDYYNVDGTPDLLFQPVVEIIVPQSITKLQAKLQLLEIGLLDEVEALISQDRKAMLYWTDSQNFLRTDTILCGMAAFLQLTDEQLDNLFIEASKL